MDRGYVVAPRRDTLESSCAITSTTTRTCDEYDVTPDRDSATGDFELEERHALRRVAGLSTELEDVTEVEYRQVRLERVVLAGVWTQGTVRDAERSLEELARLAETAGSEVLEGVIQRRDTPDPATYLGSGKARELRDIVVETGADTVICDGELTPGQLRQLEEIVKVKVVDRTWLILDIFAQHARSREGKAQVSLAQMQYLLPRLRGWGESLSRQGGGAGGGAGGGGGGGVGTRGPGETKIETDRRRIRTQMSKLRRQLKEMETSRTTQRAARHRAGIPAVAIAGYTNAGKSSVLNRITGAGVLVENALFATLDPTVRKTRTPERPRLHAGRHRRLRPAPAAPARRGVPLDAGGGARRRPDPARGRRLGRRTRGADRRGARGAQRDRRRAGARAHRHQQGRPRRPRDDLRAAAPRAARRRRLGAHRPGVRASCSTPSRRTCPRASWT